MKRKLLFLLCACMVLGGCTNAANPEQGSGAGQNGSYGNMESGEVHQLGMGSGMEIAPVTLKNNYEKAAFLADQVYLECGKNVLVSPLSLNLALGLAAEGTSGETAKEMYEYLGSSDFANWADRYLTYAEGMKSSGASSEEYNFAFHLANSIWVKQGEKIKQDYQKLVQQKFRAEAESVDFVNEADKTAKKINSWCDKNTGGMIKEIVNPKMFSMSLEAILVNSVYFESPWQKEWKTCEHEFTNLDGSKTQKEMLHDVVDAYYENEQCTAFAKDYYNGFQFIGILPKQEGEFNVSDLDLKSLMESRTTKYDVKAIAPKLDYETTANNIVDVLKAQGVQRIFDERSAEFGNMVEDADLFISDIIQKCKIELDEKGTKAAAVTAILVDKCESVEETRAKEVKEVYLDRPFAYLIYDSVNDQIMFVGKVTEMQ